MANDLSTLQDSGDVAALPRWITRSFTPAEGRDPLGFQTTTQDRLMPLLLPGILELSRRARYFSFYAFLLDEYRKRRLPPDGRTLSGFIKRCEWDLGLAVQRCPEGCGSSPVGARRLGGATIRAGRFPRGESVESALGGYGLYYRSPLATFGIVAKSGTLLGDSPIPIDVLYSTERAARLAEGFRNAVGQTAYYRRWMWIDDPLPTEVVDEYAAASCLCRLSERSSERDAIYEAFFGTDPDYVRRMATVADAADRTEPAVEQISFGQEVAQRRRSIGHYLTLLEAWPDVVSSPSSFREAMWQPATGLGDSQEAVAGQWAALIAKDVLQEAICSVWSEFCRAGLATTRGLGRGLTWEETRSMVQGMVSGPPRLVRKRPTVDIARALAAGTFSLSDVDGTSLSIATMSLEALRSLTERLDTATSGLIVMLELARRTSERTGVGWLQASRVESAWQPSIATILAGLHTHLDGAPSVGESLWWIVSKFVLPIHEEVSYSKLPEFTFRFRWEEGLLRFYDNGVGRFPLAAIRREPLASLTRDLGLWEWQDANNTRGILTDRGRRFVNEAFR